MNIDINIIEKKIKSFKTSICNIKENLLNLNYKFNNPLNAVQNPDTDIKTKISLIEKEFGDLPVSIKFFYFCIGGIDFTGYHPDWKGCDYPDPVFIYSFDAALEEFDAWKYDPEDYNNSFGSFRIPIAPDYYHKENVSGGMWYGIGIPNKENDPVLLEEWHNTSFLNYLEICLQWGGFPGLEKNVKEINWPLGKIKKGI